MTEPKSFAERLAPDEPPVILVIEDVWRFREMLAAWLKESEGYEVKTAKTHDEAVKMLAKGEVKPDLILLDHYTASEINGTDFLTLGHAGNVPVIGISSLDSCNDDMIRAGARGAIKKDKIEEALENFGESKALTTLMQRVLPPARNAGCALTG